MSHNTDVSPALSQLGDSLAQACVKLPNVHNHFPIVHPVDSLQGDQEVASVLDIDNERVGIRHVPADGAELLASLDRIYQEANLDVAVLRHAGSSSMEKCRMVECRQTSQSHTGAVEMRGH